MNYWLPVFLKSNAVAVLFFIAGNAAAQRFTDKEYAIRNGVRQLLINQQLPGSSTKKTTLVYFDRTGRVVLHGERYAPGDQQWYYREFYYDKNAEDPLIVISYHTGDTMMTAAVKKQDAGKLITLDADLGRDGANFLILRNHVGGTLIERYFSGSGSTLEPYSSKYKRPVAAATLPRAFIPTGWPAPLITGYDVQDTSYETENRLEHRLEYSLGYKNEKVVLRFNAGDAYDAGKGVWDLYDGSLHVQQKFIYGGNELSPFGTRYSYDAEERLTKQEYGYFDKLPQDDYLDKKLFFYNDQGDLMREEGYSETKKKSTVKYRYRYDQRGNWTSFQSVYDDFSGSVITRRIWYGTEPDYKAPVFRSTAALVQRFLDRAVADSAKAVGAYTVFQKSIRKQRVQPAVTELPKHAASVRWNDFLPANMVLDTLTRGDLNKDGLEDIVMVYQPVKILERFRNTERIARILFKQQDGSYRLAAESKKAIEPETANNVFFSGIEIKKGILILQMEFLRGGCTYKYRYQNGGFYLIGYAHSTGDASYTSSVDYNLSTGDYIKETSRYEPTETTITKKGRHKLRILPNFETHESGTLNVDDIVF